MFSSLSEKLESAFKHLKGQSRINELNVANTLKDIRKALLDADVNFKIAKEFTDTIKEKAIGEKVINAISPGQLMVKIVKDELAQIMHGGSSGRDGVAGQLNLATQPPAVILMAGLQGAGKTTTVAKLAKWLIRTQKKKVLTVSCDIYRPAAIEQLKMVTDQAGADWFSSEASQKPVDIAINAIDWAKRHYYDILLVDTAGRLGIDEAMMQEVSALHAAVKPIETLFVVDAMLGQDAVNTAKAFHAALPLTGVILTKLDGDSRGGAALSIRHITGVPLKFIGVSEKLDGLDPFDADRMAGRILGMGDILALVEEAHKTVDLKAAEKLVAKIKPNVRSKFFNIPAILYSTKFVNCNFK